MFFATNMLSCTGYGFPTSQSFKQSLVFPVPQYIPSVLHQMTLCQTYLQLSATNFIHGSSSGKPGLAAASDGGRPNAAFYTTVLILFHRTLNFSTLRTFQAEIQLL